VRPRFKQLHAKQKDLTWIDTMDRIMLSPNAHDRDAVERGMYWLAERFYDADAKRQRRRQFFKTLHE
jgi:hypothetical protein